VISAAEGVAPALPVATIDVTDSDTFTDAYQPPPSSRPTSSTTTINYAEKTVVYFNRPFSREFSSVKE
jgi:hypothetical protein